MDCVWHDLVYSMNCVCIKICCSVGLGSFTGCAIYDVKWVNGPSFRSPKLYAQEVLLVGRMAPVQWYNGTI